MPASIFSLALAASGLPLNDPIIYAVIGAGAGVYLFYRGFRMLQRKRLIQDTPTSKVRSASMGLVELSGQAVGPYTIPAPLTGYDCYCYRTVAWQFKPAGKSKQWKKVADERLHVPFYLRDETGQVLVDPSGAELDIHRDLQEEYGVNLLGADDPVPEDVRHFLGRHGVQLDFPTKVEEYCIKPKNALFILGTLGENPGIEVRDMPVKDRAYATWRKIEAAAAAPHPPAPVVHHPPPDEEELKARAQFAAAMGFHAPANMPHPATPAVKPLKPPVEVDEAEKHRRELFAAGLMGATPQAPARAAAYVATAGMLNPAGAVPHAAPAVDPEEQKRRQLAMASLFGAPGLAAATVGSPASPGGQSASPVEPPDHFDLHPPVAVIKGEHNPTFLISWHSQRDLLTELSWKSALYIWGGPVLTLVSVAIVLRHMGLW